MFEDSEERPLMLTVHVKTLSPGDIIVNHDGRRGHRAGLSRDAGPPPPGFVC
jgi:hypothetical protein